ncbi:MAG: polysaccharide pyruvyl transferase family protein [Clostridia bacterium]|nr:polysaccharide pyruvyl transferase family protein [Clostridia bacterium]
MDAKKKLKIGIITYHAADNYGSALQAYALNRFLTDNFSEECYVINYRPTLQEKMYALYFDNDSFRNVLKNIYIFFTIKSKRVNRIRNFDEFRKSRMNLYPKEVTANINQLELSRYDVIVCGSDQIWNIRIKDYNPVYMLKNINTPCKLSYSASMGGVDLNLTESESKEICETLSEFQGISVRENIAKKMLEECGLKDIQTHVDPTFLLTASQWEQIMSKRIIQGDYIFFYSVDCNDESIKIASWYGDMLNLPVVYVNTAWKSYFIKEKNLKWAKVSGVEDFLSLVYYSKAVLSGSFHGSAFSIIFNKPFYRIQKKRNNSAVVDDRVRSLFKAFELEDREICTENYKEKIDGLFDINYQTVNEKIQKARENTKEYFADCLLKEVLDENRKN